MKAYNICLVSIIVISLLVLSFEIPFFVNKEPLESIFYISIGCFLASTFRGMTKYKKQEKKDESL